MSLHTGSRAKRGEDRSPFHVLLNKRERKQLETLSKKMKMTGAAVIRLLIAERAA